MLTTKAEMFVEELKTLKESAVNYMKDETCIGTILDMGLAERKFLKNLYTISDSAMNYILEQAQEIDEINRKLDRLIVMLEDQG